MTLKIELSNASFEAVRYAYYSSNGKRWNMKVAFNNAISAALEAMVEEGTAKVAVGYGVAPDSHWVAEVGLPDGEHTFPAIIIRLGDKP